MTWASERIQLALNVDSFAKLVCEGTKGSLSQYAHVHIIDWCDRYGKHLSTFAHFSASLARVQELADDLVVQWELYIAATYTIDQINQYDPAHLLLPSYHFETCLKALSPLLEKS